MAGSLAKVAGVVLAGTMTGWAWGNPGQGFSWSFQTTSLNASSSLTNVAAMMRNGLAWPVVVTDYSGPGGYGAASTLFATSASPATGGPATNWQNIGTGFFPSLTYRLRSDSSPDGRVAFAGADTSGTGYGGRVSSISGGWGTLPAGTKAVSFDKNGTLYTATSTAVAGVGGFSSSAPISDMDVSPNGEVGVVTMDHKYWQYSNWLGSWTSITLPSVGSTAATDSYDLEFDSFGRPHVVATVSSALVAFDFSTVTGQWSATSLATGLNPSVRLALASNSVGTVGTAWIDNAGNVIHAYKTDLEIWATTTVTTIGGSTSPGGQVGVTYDYDDLPVLAYRPNTGNIILAYDPIIVPEPAGVALVGLVGCVLAARRRGGAAA